MTGIFNSPIGLKRYDHVQSVASNVWIVQHNLNKASIVHDVFIDFEGALTKSLPLEISIINVNEFHVLWSNPQTGIVRVG